MGARDTAPHLTVPGTAPPQGMPGLDVSSARQEDPCFTMTASPHPHTPDTGNISSLLASASFISFFTTLGWIFKGIVWFGLA